MNITNTTTKTNSNNNNNNNQNRINPINSYVMAKSGGAKKIFTSKSTHVLYYNRY